MVFFSPGTPLYCERDLAIRFALHCESISAPRLRPVLNLTSTNYPTVPTISLIDTSLERRWTAFHSFLVHGRELSLSNKSFGNDLFPLKSNSLHGRCVSSFHLRCKLAPSRSIHLTPYCMYAWIHWGWSMTLQGSSMRKLLAICYVEPMLRPPSCAHSYIQFPSFAEC